MTGGLGRSLGIRAGDGGPLLRVAALFALLEFGRGFGEIGVDTLVARQFGPTGLPAILPFLYMGLGAAGLVLALGYTAALGRLARGPLFVGLFVPPPGSSPSCASGWKPGSPACCPCCG